MSRTPINFKIVDHELTIPLSGSLLFDKHNRTAEMRYYLPMRFTNVTPRGHREMLKKVEGGDKTSDNGLPDLLVFSG